MYKQTVCSYCGVGCKFEVQDTKLKGLKTYPINGGLSCAKGMSLIKTVNTNRLKQNKIRFNINDEFKNCSYNESFEYIAEQIKKTNSSKIGFYLSGQMLNEDYYVANKLAKGFIGTSNCDTNSRLCMSSAIIGYKKSFGVDYVPVRIKDIQFCNLLILIGANPAEAHVVLFNKIKKAQKKGMKVIVIDPRFTLSAKIADLHIPLKVGSDIDLLNLLSIKLIKNKKINNDFINNYTNDFDSLKENLLSLDENDLLKSCDISKDIMDKFYNLFITSKNVITAWTMGINQSIQGVDKTLAINNLHIISGQINKEGSGPFSLTGQPNAMGGREVGGLSTTLAVHLDYNEENIKKVNEFWKTNKVPKQDGLTAFEMIEQANKGELDILIICHTDPIYHLPNQNFVKAAFKKIKLVVEINAYQGSQTSQFSHILIPSVPFSYKDGTQTNMDRTLTRVQSFNNKEDLLQDWEIFAKIAHNLGYKKEFNYKTSKDVFEEYSKMTKLSKNQHLDIFKASYDNLKTKPFVWGVDMFKNNKFYTKNKKANLFFVKNKNLSEQVSTDYPFIAISGRTRDQWHSGTKTRYSKNLLKFKELEFVEINQNDANKLNIKQNDEVLIKSIRGSLKAKVIISNIKENTIFIPITHQDINIITNDKLDPFSKEPDYNHNAVQIIKYQED